MNILTVNAGSSSLRLAAFRDGKLLAKDQVPGVPTDERATLRRFLAERDLGPLHAVSHRVVHGGAQITAPCRIDAAVEAQIDRLAAWAPLHNPVALRWIVASREAFPGIAQVAVFDTSFYAALPPHAATYALPRALAQKHGARRYGFHGLAHQAMTRRWCALRPKAADNAALITLQLGAGCSITASRGGAALDTSMGFSPLEGLVMATRAGDVDAGLLLHLQRAERLGPDELEQLLNRESGLLGLSGISGDMRELLASSEPAARAAVEAYCYRARKYVGAYLAALGGASAIVFGGGVGENAPAVRERILAGLEGLGIGVDKLANAHAVGTEALVSASSSAIEVWVIPVDEARILAEEAAALMAGESA